MSLPLTQSDFRLRRLEEQDLARVLEWRNSEKIRSGMFGDEYITRNEHNRWFDQIRHSTNSAWLVFERPAEPLGLVYFPEIDVKNAKSRWGFYIGAEHQPVGTGSALGYFGLNYGFEKLRLRKIIGEVLGSNARSIGLHKKLGFTEEGLFKAHVMKNGHYEDVLSFAIFADDWQQNRARLLHLIFSQQE
jgi:UDP-4-amino-4,6-dideoxy-N-acetyl-beta-L-altrosamine N-acetyltransferase